MVHDTYLPHEAWPFLPQSLPISRDIKEMMEPAEWLGTAAAAGHNAVTCDHRRCCSGRKQKGD